MSNSVLLRIKRQFSESEAVNFIQKELSKCQFKCGELTSETEELKHTVKKQKEEIAKLNKSMHEKGRDLLLNSAIDKRIAELNKKLSVKGAEIKKLKNEIDLLRSRLLSSPSK